MIMESLKMDSRRGLSNVKEQAGENDQVENATIKSKCMAQLA